MRLSLFIILPAAIMTALFFTAVVGLVLQGHKQKPLTGAEGCVGSEGVASTDITKEGGMVLLHGELWTAESGSLISKGEKVAVVQYMV